MRGDSEEEDSSKDDKKKGEIKIFAVWHKIIPLAVGTRLRLIT